MLPMAGILCKIAHHTSQSNIDKFMYTASYFGLLALSQWMQKHASGKGMFLSMLGCSIGL